MAGEGNVIQIKDTAGFNNWFNLADIYYFVRSKNEQGKLVTKMYLKNMIHCEMGETQGKFAIETWMNYLNRRSDAVQSLSEKGSNS